MAKVTRLLPPTQSDAKYTIQFTSRKPLMRYTGINVCFINDKDEAFMKRLTYVSDDINSCHEFDGPELHGIKRILVAPETDKWYLDEVHVSTMSDNSRTDYIFPYKGTIGDKDMAAVLEDDVFLKRQNDLQMKPLYDAEYLVMKEGMEVMTLEFTLVGGIIMALTYGLERGYSFALGGSIGLMYLRLLEVGVDSVGTKNGLLLGSTVLRLGTTFALSAVVVSKYKQSIDDDHWILLTGILGFTVYRLAMIVQFVNRK